MGRYLFPLVFLIYTLLSLVYTYPLAFHLSDQTYGYSGDNLGSIHYFWWWKESFLHNRDVRDSFLEEAPFGVTIDREPGTIFFYLPVKALSLISDPVVAYNLVLILGFPLAALSMYLLVQYLVANPLISFLAGFIFSFSPFHFWKAYNHLDLALIYPLPLFLLALLYLERKIKQSKGWIGFLSSVLLLSISWTLMILTNFYYGYFLFLLVIFYALARTLVEAIILHRTYLSKKLFFSFAVSSVITLLLCLPTTAHVFLDSLKPSKSSESFLRKDSYQRPLLNLVSLSSRPWDFLIPSIDHPIFGKMAEGVYGFIKDRGTDFKTVSAPPHERTNYLGVINLILLTLSLLLIFLSRKFRKENGPLYLTFLLVGILLLITSLPPYFFIKGYTIYLPSFFLYKIFPMFRTYSRLGIIILMLATVISSLVLSHLAKLFSKRRNLLLISYGLLFVLAIFDFLNIPPEKVIDLKTPASYLWLSKQPGSFSVVEYPEDFNVAESLFFQRVHQKGVLNFHSQSPYFGLWEVLSDFHLPRTSRVLEALGIRFALFHKKLLFPGKNPVDDLWYKRAFEKVPEYKNLPGFNLAQDFPETAVLGVEQSENPASLIVISENSGGTKVDIFPKGDWVWSGKWNDIYLINLIQGKEVKVVINLSSPPKSIERISSVKINGDPVNISQDSKLDLTVKNRINELRFEKGDSGAINFSKVTVSLVVVDSGKVGEKVL